MWFIETIIGPFYERRKEAFADVYDMSELPSIFCFISKVSAAFDRHY